MSKVTLKEVSELITKGTTPSSVGCEFIANGINFIKYDFVVFLDRIKIAVLGFVAKRVVM